MESATPFNGTQEQWEANLLKGKIAKIAQVCHEANKAWCEANLDNSQKSWEDAAEWQINSAIQGVKYRLENPDAKEDAQHNAWMEDKISNGWVYGVVKDEKLKTHPCLVPFELLPMVPQQKDKLFCAIVDSLK